MAKMAIMKIAKLKVEMPAVANQSPTRPAATLFHLMSEGLDEMLTKKELAARLKVGVRTIERWQHDGGLPSLKIFNVVLFHWPEVLAHLKANFRVRPQGVVSPAEEKKLKVEMKAGGGR
jgi:excisionase family DNA binding protein